MTLPERVSLELTRQCQKGCHFCYNGSGPAQHHAWTPGEVIDFVRSIAKHGTKAVSFGGGEPLEYDGLDQIFEALRTELFLSMTTNGLLLDAQRARISRLSPDKIHVSIHFPNHEREVSRVIRQVKLLRSMGIRAGVNLLVRSTQIDVCTAVAQRLRKAGILNDAIMYLPMRGAQTPTPAEVAKVAGGWAFQSMTCLAACGRSPRFCSIDAEKRVAHCSYTTERRAMPTLDAVGLSTALSGLGLVFCGENNLAKIINGQRFSSAASSEG